MRRRRGIGWVPIALLAATAACTAKSTNQATSGSPAPSNSPVASVSALGLKSSLKSLVLDPCGLQTRDSFAWVVSCSGSLLRINKETGATTTTQLPGEMTGTTAFSTSATGFFALLTGQASGQKQGLIDEIGNEGSQRVTHLGSSLAFHIAQFAGRTWLVTGDGKILTLDASGLHQAATRKGALLEVDGDSNHVWTVSESGEIVEADATARTVLQTFSDLAPNPNIARLFSGTFYAAPGEGSLVSVSSNGKSDKLSVPGTVNDIADCGGTIWLSQNEFGGSLKGKFGLRSISASGQILKTIPLGVGPRYISCDGSRIWVLSQEGHLGFVKI